MRQIQQILAENDSDSIHNLLTARKEPFNTPFETSEDQYNPYEHRVFDEKYRPKKTVSVPTGKTDPITGKRLYKTKKVERVRIAIPCQKILVKRAAGFLVGNPVTYKMSSNGNPITTKDSNQEKLYNAVMRVYHDNKMKYFDKRLARSVFRAREAAELWYMDTLPDGSLDKDGKIRVKLLSPLTHDKLYPHFNDYDRMDGFAREYSIFDELGVSVRHFDVYTDNWVYQFINDGGKWNLEEGSPKKHGFTKIPVVYYRQKESEWEDVEWAIERLEDCISNWGDTNDYFGTPKYFVKGKLSGFAEKGEQGSVFEGEKDTSMQVLSWDNSPVSVQKEISTLVSIIFSYTDSADISFEKMKELGSNTSGVAIRLMFTAPHMNAEMKTELFGEMFTRRSNIVANGITNVGIIEAGIPVSVTKGIDFEPVFTPFIPKNDTEMMSLISTATGGEKTTSRRRAIELNPLNDNPDQIEQEIKEEEQDAISQQMTLSGTGDSMNADKSTEREE